MASGVPSATAAMEITRGEKVSLGGSPKPSSTDLQEGDQDQGQDQDRGWGGVLPFPTSEGQGRMRLLKELSEAFAAGLEGNPKFWHGDWY